MKKSISLLLIIALLIGGFVYLGNVIKEKHSLSDLKVSILAPYAIGDRSYSDSAKEGEQLLLDYGINVNFIECKDQGFKQQMMTAAGESDLVVCVGPQFWEIADVTQEYPSTKFIWFNDSVESPSEYQNLINVVFAENEGSYLVGYVASAVSQSGVVGVVLGEDDRNARNLMAGFTQGARQVNDTIEIVSESAEGNYNDRELGDRIAKILIAQGADIIYVMPGITGEGVLKAAKDKGVKIIGLGRDMKLDYPEYEDIILCSMKEETAAAMFTLVRNYFDYGTFEGGSTLTADSSKRYIGVAYGKSDSSQILDLDLRIQVNNLKQKIVNREIKVDTAE